jgi:hypothetical protein
MGSQAVAKSPPQSNLGGDFDFALFIPARKSFYFAGSLSLSVRETRLLALVRNERGTKHQSLTQFYPASLI